MRLSGEQRAFREFREKIEELIDSIANQYGPVVDQTTRLTSYQGRLLNDTISEQCLHIHFKYDGGRWIDFGIASVEPLWDAFLIVTSSGEDSDLQVAQEADPEIIRDFITEALDLM